MHFEIHFALHFALHFVKHLAIHFARKSARMFYFDSSSSVNVEGVICDNEIKQYIIAIAQIRHARGRGALLY